MRNILEITGIIFAFTALVALGWALLCLMTWAIISPTTNYNRCEAIAKSRDSDFATTGWRSDTCYLYKGGKEFKVKL